MNSRQLTRRGFMAGTAGASAALLTARSYARALGANERVAMGLIGSGGRGRRVMQIFQKQGTEFPAVCDVYEKHLSEGLKLAGDRSRSYADHRKLLENRDLDAVLIGTPDHWHHGQLVDSLGAGKDVYLEKPMSLSVEQGAAMVRAVRASKQIVQIGMQRRSSESVHRAKKLIDDGLLGQVNAAKAQWHWNMPRLGSYPLEGSLDWNRFCGPAGEQPLTVKGHENVAFFRWRYWWAFSGGNCTDQGTHLMDVIQWFLNDSKPPRAAVCHGEVYRLQPAETPDVFCAVFEYPKFLGTWTLIYTNAYQNGWQIVFQGQKATLVLNNKGYRVFPESGARSGSSEKPSQEFRGGIPTEPHVANFLECIKSREEPNAPVEIGHWSVSAPHLANAALRHRTRAELSDDGSRIKV